MTTSSNDRAPDQIRIAWPVIRRVTHDEIRAGARRWRHALDALGTK